LIQFFGKKKKEKGKKLQDPDIKQPIAKSFAKNCF
jgi:hypothetical protein